MLHQELGRERMTQIHREVEHDRLDARLAKAAAPRRTAPPAGAGLPAASRW